MDLENLVGTRLTPTEISYSGMVYIRGWSAERLMTGNASKARLRNLGTFLFSSMISV